MVEAIFAMICGLVLLGDLIGARRRRPGSPASPRPRPAEQVLGAMALVVGVLGILSVLGLLLLLAGLAMATDPLGRIPAAGPHLRRAGLALRPFRPALGFLVLTAGIMALL